MSRGDYVKQRVWVDNETELLWKVAIPDVVPVLMAHVHGASGFVAPCGRAGLLWDDETGALDAYIDFDLDAEHPAAIVAGIRLNEDCNTVPRGEQTVVVGGAIVAIDVRGACIVGAAEDADDDAGPTAG